MAYGIHLLYLVFYKNPNYGELNLFCFSCLLQMQEKPLLLLKNEVMVIALSLSLPMDLKSYAKAVDDEFHTTRRDTIHVGNVGIRG